MPALERMIYVDDSGHPQSGLVVYGWVEFAPDRWATVLRSWLEMRKRLWRELGIPLAQELHTTEYVNGRGRISRRFPARHRHDGVEYWKDFGRDVAEQCLETLRCTEGLSVGAVFRSADPKCLARTRHETYTALIERFEQELRDRDALGMVFMDGDGSDFTYRTAHRSLWSAYASIDRRPTNEFAGEWYDGFLAERDPRRAPQEV